MRGPETENETLNQAEEAVVTPETAEPGTTEAPETAVTEQVETADTPEAAETGTTEASETAVTEQVETADTPEAAETEEADAAAFASAEDAADTVEAEEVPAGTESAEETAETAGISEAAEPAEECAEAAETEEAAAVTVPAAEGGESDGNTETESPAESAEETGAPESDAPGEAAADSADGNGIIVVAEHPWRRLMWLWVLLGVLAAAGIAALLLFVVNRWSVDITINGDNPALVEYGSDYTDAGAQARFHGSLFFRTGWSVDVTDSGEVDTDTLGSYIINYHSEAHHCTADAARSVIVWDTESPTITLESIPDYYTLPGQPYVEEGYSAQDNYDGDLTDSVTSVERDGVVYYSVTDSSGNRAVAQREIFYDDPIPPTIALNGDAEISIKAGSTFTDPGCTAEDNVDGDLTDSITVDGSVDVYSAGTYTLTYTVEDGYHNTASVTRTVTVTRVRQPDVVHPDGKIVYLTFDDGPGKYTQQLLDVLEEYNVKVTFFTVNTGYTSLLAKEAAAGHTVAIHSASHDYSEIYSSEDAYFADLYKQQQIIYDATGVKTTLVRFPGGSSNTVSRHYCDGIMTQLAQDLTDMGYQYFDWNVLSGDAGETTDTDTVAANVIAGIQQHDISIVLQHDIKGFSVDAVEQIIEWGLAHGYTFLPLTSSSPTAHQTINN